MKRNKPAPRLLEELESRILMSVTVSSATLSADQTAIVSAKASYLAAINTLGETLLEGSQQLESLVPPGNANLKLAKKAISAGTKVLNAVKKETGALGNDSVKFAAKAVAAGNADIAKPGKSTDAKVQKAGLALLKKFNADEAKINADKNLTNLYADLNQIVIANPTATTFSSAVTTLENNVPLNAAGNADIGLQASIFTLTRDLGVSTPV